MSTKFFQRGIATIKEAVAADQAENFQVALQKYTRGVEFLMMARKHEKNPAAKKQIESKCLEYMNRAEVLKGTKKPKEVATVGPAKPKKKGGGGGGGGSDEKSGDGDDDMDEETKKLQDGLSSAIVREKPNVKWEDVAGLTVAKGLLKEAVILPVKFPQLFVGKRKPWKGILLYGPPGTGKSYLAKAVATEADGSTFFSVSSSDLVSKYVGESEKLVKNLFGMARGETNSIVFIDEIDSLCSARSDGENDSTRRLKTEFLVQMQGVGKESNNVLTLGATNCPWDLDPAVRRRFQKRIYIPLPDPEARTVMFKIHIGDTPNSLNEEDFKMMADGTEGMSGSDINAVVQDALMVPIRTMQTATHFKSVDGVGLEPCSPSDAGATPMSLMEMTPDQASKVRTPLLSVEHFMRVLADAKSSVGEGDLLRFELSLIHI